MRLGQGCRSRSPWWIWCIALVSAIAVLPGAEYVTAQTPEPKKMDESAVAPKKEPSMAPEASPLLPFNKIQPNPTNKNAPLPLPQSDPNKPFVGQEDFVRMDAWIYEVASGTAEVKKLLKGIEEQGIKQQDRNLPLLSTVPYIGRLFKTQGIQLASATSGIDQSNPHLLLLQEEQYSRFVEELLEPANPQPLSRPVLMAASGIKSNIQVGTVSHTGGILKGFSLSLMPTIIDKDTIRLEYEYTRETLVGPKDVDEQLSKDQSAKDLSKSIQKSTVQTMVQFRLDQALVIASQRNFVDGPYEIVVVKCSLPYAKQNSDESPESPK